MTVYSRFLSSAKTAFQRIVALLYYYLWLGRQLDTVLVLKDGVVIESYAELGETVVLSTADVIPSDPSTTVWISFDDAAAAVAAPVLRRVVSKTGELSLHYVAVDPYGKKTSKLHRIVVVRDTVNPSKGLGSTRVGICGDKAGESFEASTSDVAQVSKRTLDTAILKNIREHVNRYSHADDARALLHMSLTLVGCISIPFSYCHIHWALRPLLVVLHGLFAMKCFIVFHDCGHRSFFSNNFYNMLGHEVTSKVCMTPCHWMNHHNKHHAVSGNMDQDEFPFNETVFHTLRQYEAMPPLVRFVYRFVRNPLIFYFGAAFFIWMVNYNFAYIVNRDYPPLQCIVNLGFHFLWFVSVSFFAPAGMGFQACIWLFLGWMCGASLGVALFHIQHSFNPSFVRKTKDTWSHHSAGLEGSSVAYIPEPLKWFTLGIEYHNLHHFSTKLPGYHLRQCYETCQDLLPDTVVLNAWDMWETLKNVLYDDENDRFVTFAEVR